MKTLFAPLLAGALSLGALPAHAADDVTLQLKWVTQAQFAGYYVALDQGFYEEEGLNVTIKPGGPDVAPAQVIAGGGADVVLDWMPSALASREKGLVATLEDGMYVLGENLNDAAFKERMVKFVRASMKGWKWAEENPDDAAMIVLDNDASGAQTEEHQKRMMGEIAKLTAGSNGALDPADYERTVASLMSGGSDPVITKAPEGAWTHDITDAALN